MKVSTRRRTALFLATGAACAGAVGIAGADDVSNSIDGTIDAQAEVFTLPAGSVGSTVIYVTARQGDGENGCNLKNTGSITVALTSSDPSVATVTPSVKIDDCDLANGKQIDVTPVGTSGVERTATITAAQTAQTGSGTFDYAPVTFTVKVPASQVQNTPPVVTITGVTGTSYAKGTVPAAGCTVVDAEDTGESATPVVDTSALDADGLGQVEVTCSYTDNGGLTDAESITYTIVDPSAPVVSKVVTPSAPDGQNGWYVSDVGIDWTVSEPESPNSLVTSGCDDVSITADQAETTYTCSATSSGGGPTTDSVSIKRDATPPAFDCAAPAQTAASNGWYGTNVSRECTASDATSGLTAASPASFTLATTVADDADDASASTGSQALEDNAGNDSTAGAFTYKVDRKDPSVAITGCPSGDVTLGSPVTLAYSASDTGSGLATPASGSIATSDTVGPKSYSTTATDNVGNTATASCSYRVVYAFAGFYQPIDNNGVYNKVKAGSVVPVKFSLGGNQGLSIFASTPSTTKIPCPNGATVDAIETLADANASGLKYDATADQYIYNWKLASSLAGTCQRLDVKLADGTTKSALFNVVK